MENAPQRDNPRGLVVGYIRVSSADQNTARQLDGLALDREFVDRVSGKDTDRPELAALKLYVREGDTILIHSMDRLARNVDDLRGLVRELTDRGVKVQFVKENLTFEGNRSPISNLLLSVLGAVAEFERDLISERRREGIEQAKRRGIYKGRKRSLTVDQAREIKRRVQAGESPTAIAREYRVNRQTIYRASSETSDYFASKLKRGWTRPRPEPVCQRETCGHSAAAHDHGGDGLEGCSECHCNLFFPSEEE